MAQVTCSIDGCENPHYGRSWCNKHWQRWKRHGDPLGGGAEHLPWPENLLRRRETQPNGCTHYVGFIHPSGYGQVHVANVVEYAHRAAYELLVGPIPEGMTVDHECHNRDASCAGGPTCLHRRCVNEDHLVAKPLSDNTNASPNSNAAKTHCPQGHAYDEANTYRNPSTGARQCMECHREAVRRAYHERHDVDLFERQWALVDEIIEAAS